MRLWVLVSKCSLESLSTWGERKTQYIFLLVGRGIGPMAEAAVVTAVSIILSQDKSSILLSKALRRMRIFCWAIAVDMVI